MSTPEQVKNLFVTFLHLSSVYLLICWTYRLDNCVKFESSPGGKTEMAFEDKSLRGQKRAYSVKCRTYQKKPYLKITFHRMSSVSVSVRVNSLEINKPEKTKTFLDATSGLPAKPVTFEERLQRFQPDEVYFWLVVPRAGNRPFTLRGHVTSFLWKCKLYDFAFKKRLLGHILNKIMVI